MIKQQFGPYLLFKKLGHDVLGETFRAGRLQGNSVGGVVLLRVYNGTALASLPIEQALQERGDLPQHVKGPQIAHGVDHGKLDGIPYSAYEYFSSRDLRTVMELSRKRGQPVPVEQALLIADRLALALTTAYESTYEDRGIRHGFVVPELVQISTEGEVRLLGFEVGDVLRQGAAEGALDDNHQRYLSPEALSGAPLHSRDDVYALGMLLLELVAGPTPTDEGQIEGFLSRLEGTHGKLTQLLRRSLCAEHERIGNVPTWHQELTELLPPAGSATFQLAFYLHNLLQDEIDKEAREREDESGVEVPVVAEPATEAPGDPSEPVSGTADAAASDEILHQILVDDAPLADESWSDAAVQQPEPVDTPSLEFGAVAAASASSRSGSPTQRIALLGVLGVLGIVGAVLLGPTLAGRALSLGDGSEPQVRLASATPRSGDLVEATDVPLPAPEAEPGDDLAQSISESRAIARIDALVRQRAADIEENLRSEYDDELERLRSELRRAQTARTSPRPKNLTPRSPNASGAVTPPSTLRGQERDDPTRGLVRRATRTTSPQPRPATTRPAPATRSAQAPARERVTGVSPPPTRSTEEPAPSAPPAAETSAEPVIVPPRLAEPLSPRYPPLAQRLRKEATVELRVYVERDGTVSQVRPLDSHGFGFDDAAQRAARRAVFTPGTRNGAPVGTWTSLRIAFKLGS